MSRQDWLTYESFEHQQATMMKAAKNARLAREAQNANRFHNRVLSTLRALRVSLTKQTKVEKSATATYSPEPRFGN